jgi:hypothetical protein
MNNIGTVKDHVIAIWEKFNLHSDDIILWGEDALRYCQAAPWRTLISPPMDEGDFWAVFGVCLAARAYGDGDPATWLLAASSVPKYEIYRVVTTQLFQDYGKASPIQNCSYYVHRSECGKYGVERIEQDPDTAKIIVHKPDGSCITINPLHVIEIEWRLIQRNEA